MKEIWVFDVDGCLVDSLTGSSLRPGALELLDDLGRVGHRLVLWSAGGAAYARARADAHGIADRFHAFHMKEGRDRDGRYVITQLVTPGERVVFVDDRPEDLPIDAEVIAVSPYLGDNPHDRGLAAARARVNGSDG